MIRLVDNVFDRGSNQPNDKAPEDAKVFLAAVGLTSDFDSAIEIQVEKVGARERRRIYGEPIELLLKI